MENQPEINYKHKKNLEYRKEEIKWILIIVYILLMICLYFIHQKRKQINETSKLKFNSVNIEMIENGTYSGKSKTSFMTVEVGVTVQNHKIIQIDVLQNNGSVKFNPDEVISQIIEQNKAIVAVSKGYELQSIVFFNAVDNALYNAVYPETLE